MKKLWLLLFVPFLMGAMSSNLTDRIYDSYQETSTGATSIRVKLSTDSTIAASKVTTDTTNFGLNLTAADNTAQKAFDTLDDMVGGGAGDISSVGDALTGAVFAAGDTDSLLGELIGIGATFPTAYVNIKAGSETIFALKVADSSANDRLVIQQNGNVGIGTTAPTTKLSVNDATTGLATYTGFLKIYDKGVEGGPASVGGIEIQNTAAGNGYGYKLYTNNGSDYFGIATRYNSASWTERLVINQITGNVGIGTTNPTYTLHVAGTATAQTLRFGTLLDNILPAGTGAANQILQTNAGIASWVTPGCRFTDTIPLVRLNIMGATAGTYPGTALSIQKNYMLDKLTAQIKGTGVTNVIFNLRIQNSGGTGTLHNLSVGQTATTAALDVTSFTGGSCPANNILVFDIVSVSGASGTNPDMRLEIHGHEY